MNLELFFFAVLVSFLTTWIIILNRDLQRLRAQFNLAISGGVNDLHGRIDMVIEWLNHYGFTGLDTKGPRRFFICPTDPAKKPDVLAAAKEVAKIQNWLVQIENDLNDRYVGGTKHSVVKHGKMIHALCSRLNVHFEVVPEREQTLVALPNKKKR